MFIMYTAFLYRALTHECTLFREAYFATSQHSPNFQVTMKDKLAAERACRDPNPIIDGRKANVNLAYLGAKPRGNVALAGK